MDQTAGTDDRPAFRRGIAFHAAAATAAALLALAVTWPLAMHLSTRFPAVESAESGDAEAAEAAYDQLLTAWILASDVRRLREDPLGVFETNNMHPFRHTLAYSENLLGIAILVWPVQAHWHDPVLTNNVALLVTIALSAYGVILLVHELCGSLVAALVAALLAVHAPWVWDNIRQLHVAAGQWTPLALFVLARLVRTRAWRLALLLGVLTAWQAWASLHWGLFLALALAAAVPVLLLTSRAARRALPQLVVAGVVAGVLVVPLALPYVAVEREMDLVERGAVVGVYAPWRVLPALADPLGHLARRLATGARNDPALTLTPWLLMAMGIVASLLVRRRATIWKGMAAAVAAGGVMTFWYALGPVAWYGIPSLYELVAWIPGLAIVRSAARAVGHASVVAAVLGGCGLAATLARLPARSARALLVAVVVGLGVVDGGWRPATLAAAPERRLPIPPALERLPPDCAVVELPTSYARQALALFESTADWHPLLNGRSGFYPIPMTVEGALLNRVPHEPSLEYLRAAGVCALIMHSDTPAGARMAVASRRYGLTPRQIGPFEFLVHAPQLEPPRPAAPLLSRAGWRVLEPAQGERVLDGSLETAVDLDAIRGERLTLDLGEAVVASEIDLRLGSHFRRYLQTYRVEGSRDGASWSTLAERPLAVPPVESYRRDPTRIVQRIDLPPTPVRFLRIGPFREPGTGFSPDASFRTWSVAEVDVRGSGRT